MSQSVSERMRESVSQWGSEGESMCVSEYIALVEEGWMGGGRRQGTFMLQLVTNLVSLGMRGGDATMRAEHFFDL